MRLSGLILLLILSYFFNPIQPVVTDTPTIEVTEIDIRRSLHPEHIDASVIDSDTAHFYI